MPKQNQISASAPGVSECTSNVQSPADRSKDGRAGVWAHPALAERVFNQEVMRRFAPEDLDLSDLAEAVRQLLESDPRAGQHKRQPNLLSAQLGGIHVVGGHGG